MEIPRRVRGLCPQVVEDVEAEMTGLERLKEELIAENKHISRRIKEEPTSEPDGIAKLATRVDIILRMEELIAEEAEARAWLNEQKDKEE